MAMSRGQMLSILNTMSDENLAQAMSAVGVEAGQDDGLELGDESAEGLEGWNAKEVSIEPPNKPKFLDSAKFVKQPLQVIRRPGAQEYLEPDDGGELAEYMMHDQSGY